MAKAAPTSSNAGKMLPAPETVLRHHALRLAGPMREWVAQKRVPPVLLLTGTSGIGKRNLGYHLAQWILCERGGFSQAPTSGESEGDGGLSLGFFGDEPQAALGDATQAALGDATQAALGDATQAAPGSAPQAASEGAGGDPRPCGECPACQRALKGAWVDFTEILPETDGEEGGGPSGTLKIEQFRRLKASMGFGAHEGAYRIILIPNADRMTLQAANSLLKLLEEPPRGWVFFLTASDPTLVLPTILSRCQTLRLKPFSPEEVEGLLAESGVSAERRRVCAQLAQGSWSKALALAEDEAWERRQAVFSFLKDPGGALNGLVDWASASQASFELLLDQLEGLCSELVRWSVAPQSLSAPESHPWLSADGKPSLVAHARRMSQHSVEAAREFWIAQSRRLAEARAQSLAPLNRKLLVQDLLIPWLAPGGQP